jgi:hypothetical protein
MASTTHYTKAEMFHAIVTRVRDYLIIITCLVLLVFAYKVYSAYSSLQHAFDGGPAAPTDQQNGYFDDQGNWCHDPGGGVVCDGGE